MKASVKPSSESLQTYHRLTNRGTPEILPMETAWRPSGVPRVSCLRGSLNSSITEEAFDPALNPTTNGGLGRAQGARVVA